MPTIPIFFTFDNNYAEPAAVAFYSLLNKATEDYYIELNGLIKDLSMVGTFIEKLFSVKKFASQTIIYILGFKITLKASKTLAGVERERERERE